MNNDNNISDAKSFSFELMSEPFNCELCLKSLYELILVTCKFWSSFMFINL